MGVKFKMEFTNVQGEPCVVNFLFADYNDDPITIYGGARPFVLGEFNQDDDMFKPIRPQQATMEILASASGIDMEDFLTDNDDDIVVRFDFGNDLGYWYGYLSQEDIQETWVATNHILILRADDGFGRLKDVPLSDGGNKLVGTFTPYELITYAAQDTVRPFDNVRIVSNLFHTSMNSGSLQTGLDQMTIDARTFEKSVNDFDDGYTVLEKLNMSLSQTIFQYKGDWFILRVEELMVPFSTNLVGFQNNKPSIGQRGSITGRWDADVGVNGSMKPIAPEMLKTVQKPSKETTIRYDLNQFDQTICNESFSEGAKTQDFVGGTGMEKFEVDQWVKEKGSILSPTITTVAFERRVEYTNYKINDDYIYIGPDVFIGDNDNWIRSCNVYVTVGDSVDIEFQYKSEQASGGPNALIVAVLLLYANDGTKYALSRINRTWVQWTTDNEINTLFFPNTQSPTEWVTFSQTFDDPTQTGNEPIPKAGYLNLLLYRDFSAIGAGGVFFKDLNFSIRSQAERNRRRPIKGVFDRYTIAKDFAKNWDETVYLDDAPTNIYKGAIYEADGFTLTGDQWFRRRYNTERYTFKRQHALARWFMNRSYKMKLEANFFGLRWDGEPIGLINTIKFVDDAPKKVFWITNMREIDFMNCTWSATLIEVFDELVEDNEPTDQDVHTFDFYYE